jgi:hypothetical protein
LPTGGFVAETRRGELFEYCRDGKEDGVRTIVPEPPAPRSACAICDIRWLSAARSPGRFWGWVQNRYQVDEIGLDGAVRRRFVRKIRWFEPWTASAPALVPMPRVATVREGTDGRLWIIIHVPDSRWDATNGPSDIKAAKDYNDLYDSIIEILDPASGKLVVSQRFPEMLWSVSDGLIASLRDDQDGRVLIDLWKMNIITASK